MTRCPIDETSPSPKNIVCLLCEFLGEENKDVAKRDGTHASEKHLVREIPKGEQCCNTSGDSKTRMPKSKRSSNWLVHLKKRASNGDCEHLVAEHESNVASEQRFIGETFKPRLSASPKEKEIVCWAELIAGEGLPLSIVKEVAQEILKQQQPQFQWKTLKVWFWRW